MTGGRHDGAAVMLPMAEAHPTEPSGRSRTHLTTPVDLAMLIQYGSRPAATLVPRWFSWDPQDDICFKRLSEGDSSTYILMTFQAPVDIGQTD